MKIDIVLMASGDSRRFGRINKLLYPVEGKPLFLHSLEKAVRLREREAQNIGRIAVVSKYEEIRLLCGKYEGVEYIYNPYSEEGISASVRLGLEGCFCENAVMFMVCDNPKLKEETLSGLVRGFLKSGKSLGCIISKDGRTTNPCIFAPVWRKALMSLKGDKGGKSIINKNKDRVYFYESDNSGDFCDIDFLPKKGRIISLVGGGGKTTLMYVLGKSLARAGFKVLLTTTTHISKPAEEFAKNKAELVKIWENSPLAIMGEEAEGGKLKAPEGLEECLGLGEFAIIEADGAKGLPIKTPEEHEPVILPESDMVIAIAGIDALGKPLEQACFRKERTAGLLGTSESHIITEEDIAFILSSSEGAMKNVGERDYIAVINKCDTPGLMEKGRNIKKILEEKGIRAYVCSLKEGFYE